MKRKAGYAGMLMTAAAIVCMTVLAAGLSGCSQKKAETGDLSLLKPLVGGWYCEESPLEDPEQYTGYFYLQVNEDGSFSMYDVEAGNPGIEGTLEMVSETELVMHVKKTVDTDIPNAWSTMSLDQAMTWRVTEDGKVEIAYDDGEKTTTLVFFQFD